MPLVAILTNCPDIATADRISDALIASRLVASANRYAPIRFRYRWQGAVESAQEHPVLFKTRPGLADAAEAEITRLHPYDVPAILRLPMDANAAYLEWIATETAHPD